MRTLDPANELNESETVLLIGQFGEPQSKGGPYPVTVTVNGLLYIATTGKPFAEFPPGTSVEVTDYDAGPFVLGATIAPFTGLGETTFGGAQYPNHCQIAFPQTTHVVQLLWSGGVTRDGVNSFYPNQPGLFRTATSDGLLNLKVRNDAGALIDYYEMPGISLLGMADLGNGQPTDPTAYYNSDADNYLDISLQLPAGFNPARIEQLIADPANSFGMQAFDPSGDTPNPAQTIAVRNRAKRRGL